MTKLTPEDLKKLDDALKLIDLDSEAAKGLLSHLRDFDLADARSILAKASIMLSVVDSWDDLEEAIGKLTRD